MEESKVLERLYGESENEFIARAYRIKMDLGLTNKELSEELNRILGTSYGESTLRGRGQYFNEGFDCGYEKALINTKGEELTSLKLQNNNGYEQIKNYKETVEINKDGTYTLDRLIGVENEEVLKDENYLLTCHGYDPKLWQIVSARNSKWNVQLKGGKVSKLYASRINIKPRKDDINILELEEHFNKFQKQYKNVHKSIVPKTEQDNMLVLPVYDLHYGKRSFQFETSCEMDSKILEERYFNVLSDIVSQVKHLNFEKVLYPIGSDFFNSDTIDNTTTRNTRQDNDLRWQEMFVKGLELVIKGIDYISKELNTKVEVFYVMGNHDTMSAFYATRYLYAWYKDSDDVFVDSNSQARRYIEYGKCLLGFTHGDKEGKRIFSLMQTEQSEAWGRTLYREFITGHIHHETVKEQSGLKVRTTSTICGTDAWHYLSGYVGNLQQIQAFVWNKNKGLRTIVYGSIE